MAAGNEREKRNARILVAEDSVTQAEQLRYLLEREGYSVATTGNGREALEEARQRAPDLIISDIVMPEMDGYALCKAIKSDQQFKDVPVMIVTTLSSVQDITMSLECGADNFLRKPYDSKSLLARIDNLLSNWELRKSNKMRMGLEIYLGGKRHFITSEREQILDLLISSYEQAIQVNEELKQREREVRELNASLELRATELETANRDLDSFCASVSHDLRSPLRAVASCAGIIEEDFGDKLDSEALKLVGLISGECHKMARLIEDLLAFARLGRDPVKTRRVSLDELVSESLTDLRREHEGRAIRFSIGELGIAQADPALLKQVFVNLLSNAIKYTGKTDNATVEVDSTSDPTSSDTIYFVRDNGAGFDMRHVGKLFGVFERLHRQEDYAGTGVGLAIVKRIVQRHGGRVWAEGAVGRGATFYFTLGTSE